MLKILVVDDEKFIRKGVTRIVGDMGEDYQIIGEASNGVEAIEIISTEKPDIVVTDIKMPKMDGIELVKHLELKYPEIKKIMLSGFDEFNYVRESMRSGAVDYLLKPIDEAQFAVLLKKIDEDINLENERKLNSINLNIKLNESLPLLKDQFIQELVCEGRHMTEAGIEEKLKYYNIRIDKGIYYILIISIDNYRYLYQELGAEQSKINSFILRNITEESVAKHTSNFSFIDDTDLVIVCSINEESRSRINDISAEIFNNLSKFTDLRFTISIGMPVGSLARLKESYDSAHSLLRYRFYNKASSLMRFDEERAPFNMNKIQGLVDHFEDRLKSCIEVAGINQAAEIIDEFCSKLEEIHTEQQEAVKAFVDIYFKIQLANARFKEAVDEAFVFNYSYAKVLYLFDTLDMVNSYTNKVYGEILKKLSVIVKRKDKRIIEVVKEYIKDHYSEDLTLNRLADVAYVNPNWLSEIFKSQTGESFVDYFTRVRIEKAKELLKDIRVKTYEVGELVGYGDAAYFSKVFKKVVGVSPSEYRNLII